MRKYAVVIALCSSAALAQTGQLSVTVLDPSGKPVAAATVDISSRDIYNPSSQAVHKPLVYNSSALANANGLASFANVPVGAYAVCAALPNSQLIDTCTFVERAAAVLVSASKSASISTKLLQGVRVTVVINDTQQLIHAANASAAAGQFRLSISSPKGHHRPLSLDTFTGSLRQYSLLVPVDTALNLHVAGSGFRVADSSGKALGKAGANIVLVFIPSNSPAQPINISLVKGA